MYYGLLGLYCYQRLKNQPEQLVFIPLEAEAPISSPTEEEDKNTLRDYLRPLSFRLGFRLMTLSQRLGLPT